MPLMTRDNARAHHAVLVAYLHAKADIADWHGVSDAANDLRELEASHAFLTSGEADERLNC